MKQIISTENAPKPAGPYSQAVVVGDMVFVAGQPIGKPGSTNMLKLHTVLP